MMGRGSSLKSQIVTCQYEHYLEKKKLIRVNAYKLVLNSQQHFLDIKSFF